MHLTIIRAYLASIFLLASSVVCSQQDFDQSGANPCQAPLDDFLSEISLPEAINKAVACNASLAEADSVVKAAEARVQQAGLMLNPELEFEMENFGGRDELQGFDGADATIAIAQPIRIGGDRSRLRSVAEAEARLVSGDVEIRRRELMYRTTTAFYQLIAAQEEQLLAQELLDLAQDLERTVNARVEAGKVSPVESTRASIETARAEVELSGMQHRVRAAMAQLAVNWNSVDFEFGRAVGELPLPQELPPYGELELRLLAAPEAEWMRRNQELREYSIDLEKARSIPDLRISVGSRQFRGTGRSAWVAGLSIPIPVFDRNQGARKAAEFELEGARRASETVNAEQRAQLRRKVERFLAAEKAAISMAEVVEPAAANAFAAVEIGYLEGKFAFADLLLAQQSFFESRRLVLESRLEYALSLCDLERLVGPLTQTHESTVAAVEEIS